MIASTRTTYELSLEEIKKILLDKLNSEITDGKVLPQQFELNFKKKDISVDRYDGSPIYEVYAVEMVVNRKTS